MVFVSKAQNKRDNLGKDHSNGKKEKKMAKKKITSKDIDVSIHLFSLFYFHQNLKPTTEKPTSPSCLLTDIFLILSSFFSFLFLPTFFPTGSPRWQWEPSGRSSRSLPLPLSFRSLPLPLSLSSSSQLGRPARQQKKYMK